MMYLAKPREGGICMTESEKRSCRACFTGHRPEKLICSELRIKQKLEKQIRRAVDDGINVFITGMAGGWIFGLWTL